MDLCVVGGAMNPSKPTETTVYVGEGIASYGFGAGHPFGPTRFKSFMEHFNHLGLHDNTTQVEAPPATAQELRPFHTNAYIEFVEQRCAHGEGSLDGGDTPAQRGLFEAALHVVGATLDGATRIMEKRSRHAFVPIGGLHHAARDRAAGFCVFNDCGVVIETLRQRFGLERIVYVDIDVHHGDGVFYGFETDPNVGFADIHQDGRTLYPGTGSPMETGKEGAQGTKLNIALPPGAGDPAFMEAFAKVESYIDDFAPEFIVFQCGADGLAGDPLAALQYSEKAHRHATERLMALANTHAQGRLLGLGGGGYNHDNIKRAWNAVVSAMSTSEA